MTTLAEDLARRAELLVENIEKVIKGKRKVVRMSVITLLAQGHLLLEDVPGTGKTTLARALARSFGGESRRIQFTPDVLPSDITGIHIYNQHEKNFEFQPGPIFAQVVLADEINRGTPRTQSSLLECMQERCVTVDGQKHPLPEPFFVTATQNPVEFQGTYPLPEAQLDRFTMRLSVGYPDRDSEALAITGQLSESPLEALEPVLAPEDVVMMQQQVAGIHISEKLMHYILEIVARTRESSELRLGASPRGSICLARAAQAHAALEGRKYVSPFDVKQLAVPVLAHRVLLGPEALVEGVDGKEMIGFLVDEVPVPTTKGQEAVFFEG